MKNKVRSPRHTAPRLATAVALFASLAPWNLQAGEMRPGSPVEVEIDVHVMAPPIGDELDILEQNLKEAALMICDVTDGRVKVTDFRLDSSDYSSDQADIFVWPSGTPLNALVTGPPNPFGYGRKARFNINERPGVIGHELGHLVLGLKDQYHHDHQSIGCGRAYSLDTRHETPQVNTIMRRYHSVCLDPLGVAANPRLNCWTTSWCEGQLGAGARCSAVDPMSSEMNTSPHYIPWEADEFPGIRPGTEVRLAALIGDTVSTDATDVSFGSRDIWYLNQDENGEAREYWIEWFATLDAGATSYPYRLGAQIVDAEGEVITPVEFDVAGTAVDELAVEFAVPQTCMPHVSSSARAVASVEGGALDKIQMVIPGATLEDVFSDTFLDVNLSLLCQEPGADEPFEVIRASDP
ncbi:MAG: hypothetical protein AAGF23_23960, partial [Acidobacteriota bacterium]